MALGSKDKELATTIKATRTSQFFETFFISITSKMLPRSKVNVMR